MRRTTSIAEALVATAAFASIAIAQNADRVPNANWRDNTDVRTAFTSVVASADEATVRILCGGRDTELGTVVASDGWILTKYSELRDPISVRLSDDRILPARLVDCETHFDLAMLKIEADLKPVAWADGPIEPQVGQLVASASPGNLPRSLGVVSLPRHGVPPRSGVLGIQMEEPDGCAKITTVVPNSRAAQAGLRVGDLVTQVDDKPIDASDALVEAIRWHKPGETIALHITRGERQLQISATLGTPEAVYDRMDEMNDASGKVSSRVVDFPSVIQHDSALRPEDCGGPLVDLSGEAIGINIARAGRIASYALPADQILPLLADLKEGKRARQAALGKARE